MQLLLHPPYLVRMCKLNNAWRYKSASAFASLVPRLVLCKISLALISERGPMHGSDTELVKEKLFAVTNRPHCMVKLKNISVPGPGSDRFLLLFVVDLPASFRWPPQRFGCCTYEIMPCILFYMSYLLCTCLNHYTHKDGETVAGISQSLWLVRTFHFPLYHLNLVISNARQEVLSTKDVNLLVCVSI